MKYLVYSFLFLSAISVHSQIISTVVGTGISGDNGISGPATAAAIDFAIGVVTDNVGNLYFADGNNNKIKKVDTAGIITTIAGTGTAGFFGDNGLATVAQLSDPYDVALDDTGNIYIADFGNQRIRKINTSGIITTYAGTGTGGYTGDGVAATSVGIWNPTDICTDHDGNLFISDNGNQRIRKVDASGIISTYVGNGAAGYSGDSSAATAAQINFPGGIKMDKNDNLYLADFGNNCIRKITAAGIIYTIAGTGVAGFAGDGAAAVSAQLHRPSAVCTDTSDNIFIADAQNYRVRKIDASGIITTIAGTGTAGYSGDGGPATAARISSPGGLYADKMGNLFISDGTNYRIRKLIISLATTTVNEPISSDAKINVYPNPATTSLTIYSSEKITTISIINLLAQTVYTNEYNSEKVEVEVSALSTGVYFIKINGTVVGKFLKS